MDREVYTIGKIKVVKQAYIVLISGLVVVGILFLLSLFAVNNIKVKLLFLFVSIIVFGLVCYEAYAVNCMVVGNCNKLAWILSIIFIIMAFAYILDIYRVFKMIDNIVTERKIFLSKTSKKSKSSRK